MIASYGHRAVQFVDLLGYFTVKTSHPSLQQNMVCSSFVFEGILRVEEDAKTACYV